MLLYITLLLAVVIDAKDDRNVQRFVKIDLSKINVKNTTDSNNVSTTTTETPTTIEGSTTLGTSGPTTAAPSNITSTTAVPTTESTPSTVPAVTTSTATTVDSTMSIDFDPTFPPLKEGRAAKLVPRGYFCQCDLKINTCDVNCCCDIDCNEAILKAFHCDEEQLHRDEYHHDEGLQSCRVQGGLFCLVEPIHEEGDESYYDPKRLPDATRFKWKDVFPVDATEPNDIRIDHYRVGDTMYFFNETSETVQVFDLPYSLTNSVCQITQPVRFLRESSNLCRRTVEELVAFNRAFVEHHRSVRFFRTPKKSTVMEHYCVEEQDCINVTLSVCHSVDETGTGWNCSAHNINTTSNATSDTTVDFLEDDVGSMGSCDRLEIDFFNNYTHLLEVRMKLFCHPDTPDSWMDTSVWQRVAVKFPVASRKHSNSTRSVSGNLGYLIGKPLIVSHLELGRNGTLKTGGSEPNVPSERPLKPMLAYFTNGTRLPDESFRLRLPISKANRCTLTDESYQTINFGVDCWQRCNFVLVEGGWNVSTESTQNYTQLCRQLQEKLYDHLLHGVRKTSDGYDNLNLYLSKYGNPINKTTDWIQLRSVNVIAEAQPGSDTDTSTTHEGGQDYFTCSNMLINVDYRFYYARQRVHDVRHQAILHTGEVVFGPRVNLRFRRDEEVRVPIFVQVQFFDLTSSGGIGRTTQADLLLLGILVCLCVCIFHL
ncbi:AGAP005448-PA-like protein [Anopheles sinensis]|uniref:AGAP005448-PA-like protein n=1 Tax=Anopheles sinensis TaxID=74873 RepID=A0A084VDL7_ANOSI|nr:AGAP005448-PA-like protein [Anopheles sinensis]